MAYTYDFKDDVTYGADDINSIRSTLVTSGVIGIGGSACKVVSSETGITILSGTAVFADGSTITVDNEGVSLDLISGSNCYVYFFNDTLSNKNIPSVSTEMPTGDYILLAEIDTEGNITDKRSYATSRYSSLATQRCYVDININAATQGWQIDTWYYVGRLNVPTNLRTFTVHDLWTGFRGLNPIYTIGDSEIKVCYDSQSYFYIKITPDYDVYALCDKYVQDTSVSLFFEDATVGSITYA